jgi:hypothetical protein
MPENKNNAICSAADRVTIISEETFTHLENVEKAMDGLLHHWSSIDSIEDNTLCEDYPFDQSFDDIFAEFVHWKKGLINAAERGIE